MKKPDFFIVGAPKSGTTAMTEYLREHPEIYVPPGKEFHHFGSDLEISGRLEAHISSREKYLRLFERAGGHKRAGEASVWYLFSRTAAREIRAFQPGARIIVMLRKPVDMLHSLHSEFLFTGDETIEDFAEALEAEEDRREGRRIPEGCYFPAGLQYRRTVRYGPQLERYFEAFGRDRVRVLFFESFRDDPAGTYREVLQFLDVDDAFQPEFTVVNPNTRVRSAWLRDVLRDPPPPLGWLIKEVDHFFPNLLHRVLRPLYRRLNSRAVERPPMNRELRNRLEREFEPIRRRVKKVLDREELPW